MKRALGLGFWRDEKQAKESRGGGAGADFDAGQAPRGAGQRIAWRPAQGKQEQGRAQAGNRRFRDFPLTQPSGGFRVWA